MIFFDKTGKLSGHDTQFLLNEISKFYTENDVYFQCRLEILFKKSYTVIHGKVTRPNSLFRHLKTIAEITSIKIEIKAKDEPSISLLAAKVKPTPRKKERLSRK